jgi:hypothetical protein
VSFVLPPLSSSRATPLFGFRAHMLRSPTGLSIAQQRKRQLLLNLTKRVPLTTGVPASGDAAAAGIAAGAAEEEEASEGLPAAEDQELEASPQGGGAEPKVARPRLSLQLPLLPSPSAPGAWRELHEPLQGLPHREAIRDVAQAGEPCLLSSSHATSPGG